MHEAYRALAALLRAHSIGTVKHNSSRLRLTEGKLPKTIFVETVERNI